jgi:phage terminase large subunit-like protein
MIDEVKHYYMFAHAYAPEKMVNNNANYLGWHHDGLLSVTEGDVSDFERVKNDVLADCKTYRCQNIAVDPYQGAWILQTLMREAIPVFEFRMRTEMLSPPMKMLRELVATERLHHNGDPVTAWCMGNLVAHVDVNDNVFPRRNLDSQKIDIAVAAIMALGMELDQQPIQVFDKIYSVPFR